jgi:Holliday junction DNA helicase RuvA
MIGSLRGVLLDRSPTGEVLVEVGGVGYRATVAPTTLVAIGELGSQVFLHVHTHVREDALVLFGFATLDERRCFEALIGAHGVGPALALAILSVHSPSALRRALLSDDVDALTLVPGVGKKTAARLLVELKSRLDVPEADLVPVGALSSPADAARAEVRAALAGLGYGPDEIRAVVIDMGEGPVEELLRSALKQLAVAR